MQKQRKSFTENQGLDHSQKKWGIDEHLADRKQDALTVLVVDDDEEDVEMIVDALNLNKDVKYISTATESLEAVKALEAKKIIPDIIFLDLNMPVLDGFEFHKILPRNEELDRIPVVFLTTSARASDVRRAVRKSAIRYIVKPSSLKALREKLDEVIEFVVAERMRNHDDYLYVLR